MARVRSPAYPGIDLKTAIERAKLLYAGEKRNSANVDVAVQHWGYGALSGPALVTISALKQFGLLIEDGKNEARSVRLSPQALAIILDEVEDSKDRLDAIRKAALGPRIYSELWGRWKNELPSDASIRTFLIRDKNFNETSVAGLIKDYKATISFAKLEANDIIEDMGGAKNDGNTPPPHPAGPIMPQVQTAQSQDGPIVTDLTFPLIGGGTAVLRVPIPLTTSNFAMITGLLNGMKAAIVKDESKPEEKQ